MGTDASTPLTALWLLLFVSHPRGTVGWSMIVAFPGHILLLFRYPYHDQL